MGCFQDWQPAREPRRQPGDHLSQQDRVVPLRDEEGGRRRHRDHQQRPEAGEHQRGGWIGEAGKLNGRRSTAAAAAVRPVGIEFGLKLELKFRLETLEVVETLGLETTAPGCFQRWSEKYRFHRREEDLADPDDVVELSEENSPNAVRDFLVVLACQ